MRPERKSAHSIGAGKPRRVLRACRPVLALAFVNLWAGASGQAINLDFDIGFGGPDVGYGAPSDAFGAAAGQPGRWNRIPFSHGQFSLSDTAGHTISAVLNIETDGSSYSTGGYAFAGNTGDFALLLNDAGSIAPLVSGGFKRFVFSGLDAGTFEIYTYAVHIAGLHVETPVFVASAQSQQTQIVTGPMGGNAFEYLITHSIHRVTIGASGGFDVYIEQPPESPNGYQVNGFQIVPVPEFSSGTCLLILLTLTFLRVRQR